MIQFSPILAIPILQIRLTIHTMDTVTDSYSKYPVSSNPKHGFQFSSPTYKWKNVIEISIFFILFNIV